MPFEDDDTTIIEMVHKKMELDKQIDELEQRIHHVKVQSAALWEEIRRVVRACHLRRNEVSAP